MQNNGILNMHGFKKMNHLTALKMYLKDYGMILICTSESVESDVYLNCCHFDQFLILIVHSYAINNANMAVTFI